MLYLVDVWESVCMVKECWVRVADNVWGKLKRGAASVFPCNENVVGGEGTVGYVVGKVGPVGGPSACLEVFPMGLWINPVWRARQRSCTCGRRR